MTRRGVAGFVHDALFYADEGDLTRRASSFLREGLEAGERAVVVCTDEHNEVLLRVLGNDERVITIARADIYRRTPAAIAKYQRFMESEGIAGGPRVRVVGEVDFGHDLKTWEEWEKYEAVVNRYLAPYPLWAVCLYNTRALPEQVLRAGLLTHPNVSDTRGRRSNHHYQRPVRFLRRRSRRLRFLDGGGQTMVLDNPRQLAGLRSAVASAATELGLSPLGIDDLVGVVNELAANAMVHGQPPVQINVARQAQQIVCDVTDQGEGFDDPFIGYAPRTRHRHDVTGRGLWLVRQVCDHVHYGPTRDGFVVRVAMDLPEEPSARDLPVRSVGGPR
jgi:anti-sigma regulatory factor (Ser/Thr protein kinase)